MAKAAYMMAVAIMLMHRLGCKSVQDSNRNASSLDLFFMN